MPIFANIFYFPDPSLKTGLSRNASWTFKIEPLIEGQFITLRRIRVIYAQNFFNGGILPGFGISYTFTDENNTTQIRDGIPGINPPVVNNPAIPAIIYFDFEDTGTFFQFTLTVSYPTTTVYRVTVIGDGKPIDVI